MTPATSPLQKSSLPSGSPRNGWSAPPSLPGLDQAVAVRELAYLREEIGQQEQGRGNLTRKAIQSVARVRWFAPYGMGFAERFVKRSLAQVTRYLNDDAIRQPARQAVVDLIGPETQIVIGHSLGSVIAYEVVAKLQRPHEAALAGRGANTTRVRGGPHRVPTEVRQISGIERAPGGGHPG